MLEMHGSEQNCAAMKVQFLYQVCKTDARNFGSLARPSEKTTQNQQTYPTHELAPKWCKSSYP